MTSPHHTADAFTVADIDTAALAAKLGTDRGTVGVFSPDGPLAGTHTTGTTWHLATCHRCGTDLAQPFLNPGSRDAWAIDHIDGTGHATVLSTEPLNAETTVILRRIDDEQPWSWICVSCTGTGHHTTALTALNAFRSHTCHTARPGLDTPPAL